MPLPSPTEQQALSQVDPEIQAIMSLPVAQKPAEIDFTDPTKGILEMRALLVMLGTAAPPDPRVAESESTFTTRDGATLRLVIYKPAVSTTSESEPKLPLLLWYYGGGGCCGAPEISAQLCRTAVLTHHCVVVCPQYRLAPEHVFPTGINDCWDATQHVANNASLYGADPSKGFVVGGESFGAVITAVMMLLARDEPDACPAPITGAFLCAGSYIPPLAVPERYKPHYLSRFDPVCLAAPGLTEQAKKSFDWALRPDYTSHLYRAILWPGGHAGLPRTYFQTCGMDINRDEAFVYRDVLERAGVETRLDVYGGAPHCFWWSYPTVGLARRWREDTDRGLKWLFEGKGGVRNSE